MFGSLRVGELLALKWRNLNLDKGYLSIENAITQVVTFDENDNVKERKTVIGDTKSAASERENPMPKILLDALREHKKRRKLKEALFNISLTSPEDLVVWDYNGCFKDLFGNALTV